MKTAKKIIKNKILILDGATGTELQKQGLPQGVSPEIWALKNPDIISSIHSDYKKAGADIIYACTFGANRLKLREYGNYNVKKINKDLAAIARSAIGKGVILAGDIGPTGQFIEPYGNLNFEDAVNIFKEQVQGLISADVDMIGIETMISIQEARAAIIAVKELTNKFIIATMTFEEDGRTLGGTDPVTALITLQNLGADAVGCNCSGGPEQMLKIINTMKPYAKVPLVAKPNAGMPRLVNGKTLFDMEADEFSSFSKKFVAAGVSILGGCCGTTPEHIKLLKKKVSGFKPILSSKRSCSVLSSATNFVVLGKDNPLSVIGECINPTGKPELSEDIKKGRMCIIRELAAKQQIKGANFLDVNVGVSGVNEKNILKKVINLLAVSSKLPLVIDSSRPEAIEAALRLYPGRALVNSISGEKDKIKKLIPIAAKYGAMFILLPLDNKGIPKNFNQRKMIIQKVYSEAEKFNFSKEDIIVDGMLMSISSKSDSALESLKLISWASNVFKVNTVVGLSNISFGMPKRSWINSAFLAMAQSCGLTTVIANPLSEEIMTIKKSSDLLLGKDKNAEEFIKSVNRKIVLKSKNKFALAGKKIFQAIMEGDREGIRQVIGEALNFKMNPDKIIKSVVIPAINEVGDLFERKEYFLPQLIASAEAAKIAFGCLEPYLKSKTQKKVKKIIIILATVKGDIHDIGKNIVALMLRNHGFLVIDLGKDVPAKKIIQEAKKHKFPIIGLSALMTTTMVNIKEIINLAKKEGLSCRFISGGAVVTKAYARSIDSEYAGSGVEAVRVAKKLSSQIF